MVSVARLEFEFESCRGVHFVDIDRDYLVTTFPDSFFASLFSDRWSHLSVYKILVPKTIIHYDVDSLKFRKNIVPLLLNSTISPTHAIKHERFIDLYLASIFRKANNLIYQVIQRCQSSDIFRRLKDAIIVLNWLYDNNYYDFIQQNFNKWKPHFNDIRQYCLNRELYYKYLFLFTIYHSKTKQNFYFNPFESIDSPMLVDLISFQPSPFRLFIQGSKSIQIGSFVRSLDEFHQNLKSMCPFLDTLPWNYNLCVAGGCILSSLTNGFYPTRDIDIFVYTSEVEKHNFDFILQVIKIVVQWAQSDNRQTFFINENGVVTIVVQNWPYSFQLIPITADDTTSIIDKFDCDINQCNYNGRIVMCSESFLYAVSTNTVHHFHTTKEHRLYRFLEKGFHFAETINLWTYYNLLLRHTDEQILNHDQVMKKILSVNSIAKHINKHFDSDLVFQCNETIFATLTKCYENAFYVTKDCERMIKCWDFEKMSGISYISDIPRVTTLSDCQNIKLDKHRKRKLWFIKDDQNNQIVFFLKNVLVQNSRFGGKRYTAEINDPEIRQSITNFENKVYKMVPLDLPLRSRIFENKLHFFLYTNTTCYGIEKDCIMASVLIRIDFIRTYQSRGNYDAPFLFCHFSSDVIRWHT